MQLLACIKLALAVLAVATSPIGPVETGPLFSKELMDIQLQPGKN